MKPTQYEKSVIRQNAALDLIKETPRSIEEVSDILGLSITSVKLYFKQFRENGRVYVCGHATVSKRKTLVVALFKAGNLPDAIYEPTKDQIISKEYRDKLKAIRLPREQAYKVPKAVVPEFKRQSWFSPLGMYNESELCKLTSQIYSVPA